MKKKKNSGCLSPILGTFILLYIVSGCFGGGEADRNQDKDYDNNNSNNGISHYDDNYGSSNSVSAIKRTDTEVFSVTGHPLWLEDYSKAENVWSTEIKEGRVVAPGIWETIYGEDHILEITTYEDDSSGEDIEYIGQLYFHFDNCTEDYTLDEAVQIVVSYLPTSTIEEFYYERESYWEERDNGGALYHKWFRLKTEDSEPTERYNNDFDVLFWTDENGNVTEARIGQVAIATLEGTHKWEYKLW